MSKIFQEVLSQVSQETKDKARLGLDLLEKQERLKTQTGEVICLQKLKSNGISYWETRDIFPYVPKRITKKRYNQLSKGLVSVKFTGSEFVLEHYEPIK
jgi:hypothetical protein